MDARRRNDHDGRVNVIAWRSIGIFGYTVVFPLTCLALSSVFREP